MIYKQTETYTLYQGKMQEELLNIANESIDSIVCDPPYALTSKGNSTKGFMGKEWDNEVAMNPETWEHCFRVLKRGGYLLAFGGTRTFHRIACAIEDAGFEIRDTIMWLYGSGFPKSMNIGKAVESYNVYGKAGTSQRRDIEQEFGGEEYTISQTNNGCIGEALETTRKIYTAPNEWQGWGTALKPAYEPIIVARKPVEKNIAHNVLTYGVGGINIDECRIGNEEISYFPTDLEEAHGNKFGNGAYMPKDTTKPPITHTGRFPSNVILTYDDNDFNEVCGGMPEGSHTGHRTQTSIKNCIENRIAKKGNSQCDIGGNIESITEYTDYGSASRYFYCAKASKKDRDEGLEMFEEMQVNDGRNTPIDNAFQRGESLRKNIHPTVKPIELMQYLVRLVSPKGATILDCFMGSGSTGKAVMFENRERNANYKFIGIEMTEEYLPIASARIDYALNKFEYDAIKVEQETGLKPLF